ncbi:hypothetical protein ABZT04_03395 [Streptomyces sp. NPDC005492]|uniref:hypothetical protein n=1 Tax=Streptomyces sp. NPDC005492 TaxID=3156883 RepID=UPI0033A919C3
MDIISLTVVLSAVVVAAASVLIAANEPPLWIYALSAAGAVLLSDALLHGPAVTSVIGDDLVGTWAVRIALTSTVTAVLGFFVGRGRDRERRAGAEDVDVSASAP